jgi:hypothetical protein
MGRPSIGKHPMTDAERQRRRRERLKSTPAAPLKGVIRSSQMKTEEMLYAITVGLFEPTRYNASPNGIQINHIGKGGPASRQKLYVRMPDGSKFTVRVESRGRPRS